ncbi:MAG: hypothetical protein NTV09_03290, partial [Bacteroidetes bacterium]|nr:hypothetical protein [Bacteroidota bacterium]
IVEIAIEDALGQTSLLMKLNVKQGLNSAVINIDQLDKGVYNLKLRYPNSEGGISRQVRFVKGLNQD